MREFEGVKVGIFGIVLQETLQTSRPGPNVDILDPCTTAAGVVPKIHAAGAQVIVALTHLAMADDKRLARCSGVEDSSAAAIGAATRVVQSASAMPSAGSWRVMSVFVTENHSCGQHPYIWTASSLIGLLNNPTRGRGRVHRGTVLAVLG